MHDGLVTLYDHLASLSRGAVTTDKMGPTSMTNLCNSGGPYLRGIGGRLGLGLVTVRESNFLDNPFQIFDFIILICMREEATAQHGILLVNIIIPTEYDNSGLFVGW